MEQIKSDYKILLTHRTVQWKMFLSGVLFAFSMYMATWSQAYAKGVESVAAPDFFLDRIPVYDVSVLFFWGIVFLAMIPILFCMHRPTRLPFILELSALFFIVRSFFIILTHLAPPVVEHYRYIELHHGYGSLFLASSGYDMFFSGHAGYPFLFALFFWENMVMRISMLAVSAFMGAVVLLGHLHYSIDVFAAYFIAFGVFTMAKKIFPIEFALATESKS